MKFNASAFKSKAKLGEVHKNNNGRLRSIGTKLFLFFFASIVIAVALAGTISYAVSRNAMERKVAEVSEQSLQQTAEKLDYLFNFYENISVQLVLDQTLMSDLAYRLNMIQSGKQDGRIGLESTIGEKLKQAASTNRVYIHLFDEHIYKKVDTARDYDAAMFSSGNGTSAIAFYQPYFERIAAGNGGVVWLGAIEKGDPGREINYISMGKQLKTNSGNYFLFIEFKDEVIAEALENAMLSSGKLPELVGGEGQIVYTAEEASQEAETADGEAAEKRTHTEIVIPEEKLGSPQGSFIHNNELVVFSTSERTGWRLLQTIPLHELTKDINGIFVVTLVLIAAAIVISIVLGFIIARMIGKPINQVRSLMEKLEKGNLAVRMNVQRKDEIGALGQSFNQMAENIGKLITRTNGAVDYVLAASNQLQDVSKQMEISAREVSLATDEIARGADELSSQAEEGSGQAATIQKEMNVFVQNNLDMQRDAGAVKEESQSGIERMEVLLRKTNEGEALTKETLERAQKLMEGTGQIKKILLLLDDVAKRTNLLSLNAAIEAARAGEHGKGFMVVAQEVRQLADQSRSSIVVVSGIINAIVEDVEETVQALNNNYPIYQEQIEVAGSVDRIFKKVDGRMNDFVQKIEQASASVSKLQAAQATLSDMILHVSATAEQSTAISEEVASSSTNQLSVSDNLVQTSRKLNELSMELKSTLSAFRVEE